MNQFRILILGTINGALYSAIILVLVWQLRAYEYNRNMREAESFGHLPVQLTSSERWVPMVVAWIVMFALAALVVNHFWTKSKHSVFFWEAIGVIAVSAWNVFILSAFWLEKQLSAQQITYGWVTSPSNPLSGPISLGVVLIVNFVYAQAVISFKRKGSGIERI